MPIRAIAYTSEAAPGFDIVKADDLARRAATFNLKAGVTGLLLFDGARFLQYIEGPEDGIAVVYSRVINDPSHSNLVELGRAQTGRRYFPYWTMRLLPAEPAELRGAISRDWTKFALRSTLEEGGKRYGVECLSRIVMPHLTGVARELHPSP